MDARIHNRQIRSLLERGHEVTYLAPFSAFGVEPPAGVRGIDVPRSAGRHRLGPVLAAGRIARRLAGHHDVVIGHDPELLPVLHALRRSRGRRHAPAVVWDVHEDVPAQMEMTTWVPGPVKRPATAVATAVEGFAERRLHLTLAEHAYASRFRGQHPVVPNSPRVPAELPDEVPAAPGEPQRLVYVGAITTARGIEEMLELVRRLPDDVRLELIGNAAPALDARLRALDDPRLDYRGFVPNAQALQRLPGALAGLVLLHRHDNYLQSQPSKALEYLAHGVPFITTPNPASAALAESSGAGIVVGHGDVDGLLAAVLALRDDPERRQAMRVAGHTAALAHHDWNRQGREFAEAVEAWAEQR